MTRGRRMLIALATLAAGALAVLGLTEIGARSAGPLGHTLTDVAGAVGWVEGRVARRLRGPGREAGLRWLEPMRDSAWLRQPDVVLLGAYDEGLPASLQGVLNLESRLGTTLPLIHMYTAWGDRPEQRFPLRQVRAIWDLGSVPVITWEPWLVDFENRLHPHLPLRTERDRGGLAAIASGQYDFYVDAWATEAAEWGRPLLVRWGHEMNDPYRYPWGPQNNPANDYIAAWRHVVGRFRAAGANNVIWVWSPHLAYEGAEWYYPGDDVVDWVATGVLNYGTSAHWSRWWSFAEIYEARRDVLSGLGKPVMIAEFGTLAVGGDRSRWLREALQGLPSRLPEVRAILFFGVSADTTVSRQALNWSLTADTSALRAVSAAIAPWAPGSCADGGCDR